MPMPSIVQGDVYIQGNLSCTTLTPPAGSITDAAILAAAKIAATKLQHQHRVTHAQPSAEAAADETRVIHVVIGATGVVVGFVAGAITPAVGNATVAVDLKKNGTTILTAPISLTSAQAARALVAAAIASANVVAGNVLEIAIVGTVGEGTLPAGLFAALTIHEDAV